MSHRRRLPTYLRAFRRRAGLTQGELASLLGYTKEAQLSRLEQAKVPPSLFVAVACELIFHASMEQLFPATIEEIKKTVESRLEDLERKLQGSTPKGRELALIAHKLEWLWERRQPQQRKARATPRGRGHVSPP